jgi:hypothetical protein
MVCRKKYNKWRMASPVASLQFGVATRDFSCIWFRLLRSADGKPGAAAQYHPPDMHAKLKWCST